MWSDLMYRLRALFQRHTVDAEMDDELQFHFEQEVRKHERQGIPREDALRHARLAFGGVEQTKEECREARGVSLVSTTVQDLRYGLRQLRRNPGFTAVAVITLALGIASTTTVFSAVSAVLLRKPPVKDSDRLCVVSSKNVAAGYDLARVSAPDFQSWQKESNVFQEMAAVESGRSFTLTGNGEPEQVHGDHVTPDYFHLIGIMPVLGRAFLPSENQTGNNHVVILSDSLWRARFGSSPNAIGESLRVNGDTCRIVGVMPPRAELMMSAPQLWAPLVFAPEDLTPAARGNHYLNLVLGRLKPGVTVKGAQAQMELLARRLARIYSQTNKEWGVTVLTLQEYKIRVAGNVREALILLLTIVGSVLLVACANIAGLLLAWGVGRSHELAIRSAVGASRARLLRQMLAESLLISIAGGTAGLLLAVLGVQLLRAAFNFNEYGRQVAVGFRLNQPTLLFALAVSLFTAMAFGLVPAVRASKASDYEAIGESGRTGPSFRRSRLRSILVTGEVAVALILLTAACVMTREMLRELNEPNGFNSRHLMITYLDVSSQQYKTLNTRIALFQQVTAKLSDLPEVEGATVDSCVPMDCSYSISFKIPGRTPSSPSDLPSAGFFVVGPDYFRTMQIPLIKGRALAGHDNAQAPVVAIVNREFVRRFFPNENAIGKQIEVEDGNHKQAQIVGVVGNVNRYMGEMEPDPQIYECYLQIPVEAFSNMALIVRSRAAPATIAPMLRNAVWAVDKNQPVGKIQTMQELTADQLGGNKLMAELMGLFAGLALALAAVGTYGLTAYSVVQRTREIGIRLALGATKQDVLSLVLRQGGILTGAGCAMGICLALPLPHLLSSLFNGFAVQGPQVAVAMALVITPISLLATYIPARRATTIDPIMTLRDQ